LLQRVAKEHEIVQEQLQTDQTALQTSLHQCQTHLEQQKATAISQESSQTLLAQTHDALVTQHEDLLQQHAVTMQQRDDVQRHTKSLETSLQQQTELVQTLQEQVQACTTRRDEELATWTNKLENAQAAQLQMTSSSSTTATQQLLDLQLALRRRYTALLTETYGNPVTGPSYLVEFTIQVPNALWAKEKEINQNDDSSSMHTTTTTTTTLVVQLNHVAAYPVTTWTFLQMVQKGLYTGTQLFVPSSSSLSSTTTTTTTSANDDSHDDNNDDNNNTVDFILGGNAQYVAHPRMQANLTRRLAEYTGQDQHGTTSEPFLWLESTAPTKDDTLSSSSSSSSWPPPPPCDPRGGFGFATKRAEFVILTSPRATAQVAQHYANHQHDMDTAKQSQQESSQEPSSSYPHSLTCPGRIVHGLTMVQQILHATLSLQQQQQHQPSTLPAATITSARIVSHKFENTQQEPLDHDDGDDHDEPPHSSSRHSEL
jgi:cyclophilin family peptidyl-prolyl cis-trans isomerase